jgi:hypothetical protein
MGAVMIAAKQLFPHTLHGMIITILSGGVTYLVVLLFIFKVNIIGEARTLINK